MPMVANGPISSKSLSWDQVASGDFPPHDEPPTVDEQHLDYFQHAVTQAAALFAKNKAIPMAPGKIEKAMDLVLTGAVKAAGEGTYTVKSGAHTYQIAGECTCADAQHRSRYCKHYLAVLIWKKAQATIQPGNGSANGNGRDPAPGAEHLATPISHDHLVPQSAPLPAIPDCGGTAYHWTDVLAPICHTVKYVVDGIEHCTVIRGDDMAEVMAQVKELTAIVKKGREAETVPTEDIPYCDMHKCHFERHSNAKGSWFSHRTADGWCRYSGKK